MAHVEEAMDRLLEEFTRVSDETSPSRMSAVEEGLLLVKFFRQIADAKGRTALVRLAQALAEQPRRVVQLRKKVC